MNNEIYYRNPQTGLMEPFYAMNKIITANSGNVIVQDENGNAADGGVKPSALVPWALMSNGNILINSYFLDPINQRGRTEYSGTGYSIDRWYLTSGGAATSTVKLLSSGITIEGNNTQFLQYINTDLANYILGKVVTASILVNNKLYTNTFSLPDSWPSSGANNYGNIPNLDGVVGANFYIRIYSSKKFAFVLYTGDNVTLSNVVAVKFELGDHQTLAHQDATGNWVKNAPPPDRALELEKCQRYGIELIDRVHETSGYSMLGVGQAQTSTKAYILVSLPATLRSKPTIICSGSFRMVKNGAPINGIIVTNILIDKVMSNGVCLVCDGTFTQGDVLSLWSIPNSSVISSVFINAEIY